MDKKDLLRDALNRAKDLCAWFTSTLSDYEGRSDDAVARAVSFAAKEWSGSESAWRDSAHWVWETTFHDLNVSNLKGEVDSLKIASDLLGAAEPAWTPWEVPLIVGLMLADFAAKGFRSANEVRRLQAGLLLADAVEAKRAWVFFRGIGKSRTPDESLVRFEGAISDAEERVARQAFARSGGTERQSKYALARDWIVQEWAEHCGSYDNNKSAFARDYMRMVKRQHGVDVKEKTIREVWLRHTPAASKRARQQAGG